MRTPLALRPPRVPTACHCLAYHLMAPSDMPVRYFTYRFQMLQCSGAASRASSAAAAGMRSICRGCIVVHGAGCIGRIQTRPAREGACADGSESIARARGSSVLASALCMPVGVLKSVCTQCERTNCLFHYIVRDFLRGPTRGPFPAGNAAPWRA